MNHQIEIEREEDGRLIAVVPDLPGVMAYGKTQAEATSKVKDLAAEVIFNRKKNRQLNDGACAAIIVDCDCDYCLWKAANRELGR